MTAFKGLGTTGNGAGVVTPLDHKLAQAGLVTKTTTPLLIRPGVFYSGTASLVSGTAGMAYSVAAYEIVTQRSAGAGVVFGGNDGALSVSTTAAPGSNSRIDIVYHWQREYSLDGVDSNPVIGVAQGTAAASPTAPSLAAFPGAIELARIVVPAGVTATNSGTTFTQTAPFTSVDHGAVPFRTTTEMNLWTTALPDQLASVISTGTVYQWFSVPAKWIPLPGPMCRVYWTGAGSTSATSALFTALSYNNETYDNATMHDNVTNSSRLTAPIAGYYDVFAKHRYSSGTAVGIQVAKNGTAIAETQSYVQFATGAFGDPSIKTRVLLAAGDYIEILIGSAPGSAALFTGQCYAEMSYVGGV